MSPTNEIMIDMYREMCLIRRFEETVKELHRKNLIRGAIHLAIGQEACPVGVNQALLPQDYVTATHRGHGYYICKKGRTYQEKISAMIAELLGKATGCGRGRVGEIHLSDPEIGVLSQHGILASHVPICTGIALASKMTRKNYIVAAIFGDGSSNLGAIHESMNLASIWSLPILFVCENNQFAQTTPMNSTTSVKHIAERASAYSIPGKTLDGNDVIAVYAEIKEAAERARDGGGPMLLELMTYRWEGHWQADPQPYRTQKEIDEWKKMCPIKRLVERLEHQGILGEETRKLVQSWVENIIEGAVEFAIHSPEPDIEEVFRDVYSHPYSGDLRRHSGTKAI